VVSFESLAASLEPDPKLALLLVEVGPGPRRLKQAQAILAQGEAGEMKILHLDQGEPVVLLVHTTAEKARRLIMTLIENGFTRLKSIYPARSVPPEARGAGSGRE